MSNEDDLTAPRRGRRGAAGAERPRRRDAAETAGARASRPGKAERPGKVERPEGQRLTRAEKAERRAARQRMRAEKQLARAEKQATRAEKQANRAARQAARAGAAEPLTAPPLTPAAEAVIAAAPAPAAPAAAATGDDAPDAPRRRRRVPNPYMRTSPASAPSVDIAPDLAERLLAAAIDTAEAHFRQYIATGGAVTDAYRSAIAKTLDFTREHAQSPTFHEDDFVSTAVLVSLLEPKLIALAGASADAVAAAYATSTAKVVALARDADKLARAIARDTFSEEDFGAYDFGTLPEGSLAHISDQVSTARRLLDAEAKGFDAAIVVNSPGIGLMTRQGPAPVPTLPMILNAPSYRAGDVFAWSTKRRRFEVTVSEAMLNEMARAAAIIDRVVPFPDLSGVMALPVKDQHLGTPALVLFR